MNLVFAIKKLDNIAGGAERVLSIICSELSKRGHTVNLITFDGPETKLFYKLDNKVNLIKITDNVRIKSNRFFLFISRFIKIRKEIINIDPDIVVGFMHSIYVLLAFSLLNKNIPVIGSEHIVPDHYKNRKLEYFAIILSTLFIKKITVLSDDIKYRFSPLINRKMISIPNPIELKKFNLKKKDKSNFTILTIGRLEIQKDQKTLIKAFNLLANEFTNWNLTLIGDGPLKIELEKLIKEFKLSKRIFIVEVTSEIWKFYNEADLFVMPSKYESFGLVVAEAMGFKLPVIGFRNCLGINKLIVHNKTGLLIDSELNRVESLALGMRKLMSSKVLREKLGSAGYKKINSYYSKEYVIDLWENLLLDNKIKV